MSTVFTSQTQNDSIICLEQKKVNFLVEWHLRAKSLMVDTNIMAQEIRCCDAIIEVKDRQIATFGDVSKQKDTIIQKTNIAFIVLAKKLVKSEKKTKFYKNTSAILVTVAFILTGLVIIK